MSGSSKIAEEVQSNRELPPGAACFTVFLCILFGANAVAIKVSLTGLGIFTTAGLRFSLAAIAISLWAMCTGRSLRVDRVQIKKLFIFAILFITQISLFYHGLSRTTASHGTLIANLLPFVVLILAHFTIPGDSISRKKVFGIFFGFCGVLLLVFDRQAVSADIGTGDLIIFCAVLIWGISAVYVKKMTTTIHPVLITLYPMFFAVPVFFTAGFLFDEKMVRFVDSSVLFALLYQSFVTASFGFISWNSLIRKYGTTAVHSFVYIMPVSGVFFGVFLLGEPVTPFVIGAIVLIIIGILVLNRKSRQVLNP